MKKILAYRNFDPKNLVVISGLTRSGKALTSMIVSSFKNAEKNNLNSLWENIIQLRSLNKINSETSKYLIKSAMAYDIYNLSIGRNLNFRPSDFTSCFLHHNYDQYKKRLKGAEGVKIFSKFNMKKKIIPFMLHEGLMHAEIIFDAFSKLKMINIQRNPIDITYSWIKRGYTKNALKKTDK